MSTSQRERIEKLARGVPDPVARARRVYLEEPSFCLGRNRDIEFAVKSIVAEGLKVPYRSVAIAGSAQLGFSPHKGTDFTRGVSDLDLAILHPPLFQSLMELCISETKAFTDLQKFSTRGGQKSADELRDYIVTKGMIRVDLMPLCKRVQEIEAVLARASAASGGAFSDVNLAAFLSEALFCRKQNSGLRLILDRI
ncbi:hypothetical protein D3C71_575710 [compost metagenome]